MADSIIHCTEIAQSKICEKLSEYNRETGLDAYIELSIRNRGCSGLSYSIQYIVEPDSKDYVIEEYRICIKADSLLWIMGTHLDYQVTELSSGFVFTNPHQKRSCHCGEAFYV